MEETEKKAGGNEQMICRSWNCKNVSGDNSLQCCERHYNYYSDLINKMEEEEQKLLLAPDEQLSCRNDGVILKINSASGNKSEIITKMMKKKEEMEMLPPDEQRCSQTGFRGWRCKNFRMGLGAADNENSVPKSKHCEKHYNSGIKASQKYLKKRRAIECRGSKRRRKVTEEDDVTPATSGDTISGDGTTANIRRKRKNVERTEGSGEPESWTKTWEPVVKSKSTLVHYKSKCFELFLELEKKKVELEKKKIECTKLQSELAEVVRTRKTTATEETEWTPANATEYWRKMYSDLESRVLRIENGNSTMAECVESRISKMESLALRSGMKNSILRFADLRDSLKTEPGAQVLQNDVTQSVEKQIDETSCGGKDYSHVYELKTKEEVLDMYENVKQGKGLGCSEERPSQHHLDMSKKPFANSVSHGDSGKSLGESEASDSSSDSETSLGSLMDMLAMKYRNRNEDQDIKWKFEADMLSSFEEDPELNMKAVCALYRQHVAEVEISTKGLFHYSDALRGSTLAKFLMDGACKGDLKKSVKELEKFDSKGFEDCKNLARGYSKQLFSIYQSRKDPFFLPTTTASHGDQTAK